MNLFAVKWLPTGEFLEICSYYRLPAAYEPVRLMQTRTPTRNPRRRTPGAADAPPPRRACHSPAAPSRPRG